MTKAQSHKMPFYTGVFYYLVRPIARIGIWMYYRKIFLSHTDRIPKNKPVILAANHPTGFMEPCVMAVFMWRPLYFLVRGDFFRKPIFNFLMRSLNMIPIYRKRDGNFRDLKSNYTSFAACYAALKENRTIMIFPEGSAVHEKRLRPIHKGISRLAYGAFQQYPDLEDLYIVPVGVSYTYSERPRSEMMVSCGEAISVRKLIKDSDNHFARFDRALRGELTERMMDNLVHIKDQKDEPLVEHLQQIKRGKVAYESVFPVLSREDALLKADRSIANPIDEWPEDQKTSLLKESSSLLSELEKAQIPLNIFAKDSKVSAWRVLALILWAIPVWVGYVFVFLPAQYAKRIADQKVKRTEFYSPILLSTHLGIFLIFYTILFITSLAFSNLWIFAIAVALGLLAFGSLWWREALQQHTWAKRYQKQSEDWKEDLSKKYHKILTQIAKM